MRYQFDNPPTRQAMIEEFGVTEQRLTFAEHSIMGLAKTFENRDASFEPGKTEYDQAETAGLLVRWGIAPAFALHCVRLDRDRGTIEVLDGSLRAVFRVSAVFDRNHGRIDSLRAEAVWEFPGEGGAMVRVDEESEIAAWRLARNTGDFGNFFGWFGRAGEAAIVIRFPLSRPQAYRKFLSERWHDPGVPAMERFACPEDRACAESFRKAFRQTRDRLGDAIKLRDEETNEE